jgi:hypothetical protein
MKNPAILFIGAAIICSCSEPTRFESISPDHSGVTFNNIITETDSFNIMTYEYIYNGAGVGVGDLNNDNLPDLVFGANQVSPKVYMNLGGFKFRDVTSKFTGLANDQWYSGVSIVDINNDGWLDIYLTSTARTNPDQCKNRLWVSSGQSSDGFPVFTEMAEQYGIADKHQGVAAGFFDYDNDGDLDLYVLNNTVSQRMNTSYRTKITDGTALNNDRLYRNNGDGTFTDVTFEAGIVYEGFGLGMAMGDVNKDGYPDIYITNDYISNDLFYINQKDGTFKNMIRKYMSYQSKSSMGNDMADINNDGNPDMFTLDMMPEYYYKKRQTINGFSYQFYVNDAKYNYEHQILRNMLHLHNGFMNGEMLPYSEIGQMAGLYASEWSWSPLFADYDNDGDKDLIVANGYHKDLTDKDWTFYKVKVYGYLADMNQVIELAPSVKIQNFAFENRGDLNFIKRSKEWLPDIPTYSYGAAFTDLDNDGDLDYVANNLNDEAFVLKNNTVERGKGKTGFLKIRLEGSEANRMAIGAKIELWCNGNYQFIEHFLTHGYASSVDPSVHFGLGSAGIIDSVKITWPSTGKISLLKNIQANQTLDIRESDARVNTESWSRSTDKLMFSEEDGSIDYLHEQTDFIDFFLAQPIIPHKFSQIGPRMAKGDINGDKLDDLIIGSTNMLPTSVYLRSGDGRFIKNEIKGLTEKREFSESDLIVIDADNDGDNDLVAAAGGYENNVESEYVHCLYRNNNGIFTREKLDMPHYPASVTRAADFDKDGDMDLFIGARVKREMYPYSNYSWILINNNGLFKADSTFRLNLGMVTDALWSDYDSDGWTDLLVAREWNSVAIVKNIGGKELVIQNNPESEAYHGIWFSIISGDFDLDGDDDYIAGNLGDNHRFNVSTKYPMSLYAIDLDLDGKIDPVSTAYWKDRDDKMREYPVNYFDELRAQSVFFEKRFNSYAEFSFADFPTIVPSEIMNRLEFRLKVNTTSSYVIWNDKGTLRYEPLPKQLQFSPVKKMVVRDFNGDKYPDILLGGNDHTYDVSTGYYDALKGNILISNGPSGSFKLLTPSQTGILLRGMVESLLFFEGDTSYIVAGINRGKTLVYRQNKAGK